LEVLGVECETKIDLLRLRAEVEISLNRSLRTLDICVVARRFCVTIDKVVCDDGNEIMKSIVSQMGFVWSLDWKASMPTFVPAKERLSSCVPTFWLISSLLIVLNSRGKLVISSSGFVG
jgi:hypothetical protein